MAERFDLVLGLGSACSCTQALRAAGLQLASFPLDWVSGGDLKTRTDLVTGGFAGWMSEDAWTRIDNPGAFGHDTYLNRRTGLVHPHDFDQGQPLSVSYPAVKAKYDRRVARLLGLLASAKRVQLVWIGDPRDAAPVTTADAERCLASFRACYPETAFRLLAFDCRAGVSPERPAEVRGADYRVLAFDYRSRAAGAPPWAVEPGLLAPGLSGLAVRDYRTAAERQAYAASLRRRERARFGAASAWGLLVTKLQYRICRHVRRRLEKRGMRLD